jgi:general secretion pathway protein G
MVAATLIGVFAALIRNELYRKKRAMARAELASITTSLDSYYLHNGYYPTTNRGLGALMNQDEIDPGIIRPPVPPFRMPRDPWGHSFVYESDGNSYVLKSLGPTGNGGDPDLTITVTN